MSSQGSPDSSKSSKKRKSPFESPIAPGLTNKRRRSLLSLNKEYLEQHSQRSNDSFMKYEDEDTRSLTSVSVASISSEQVLLNYTQSTQRDYKSIASKFGVNEKVAKKYYTFLRDQPTVAIIRILPIKRELLSPSELEETIVTPPVFIARKRGKKKQSKAEQGSSLFSESNVTNNSAFNDSNSMQNETLVSAELIRKKKLNKRVKENIENYLQTLNGMCDNKEENSPESSKKKEVNLSKSFENVAYDSENEFRVSKSKKNQKSAEKPVKKSDVVTNPFSKDAYAQTNSKISEKKNSFWRKKFGSGERSVRRRRFFETFVKKENDSETETGNEHESLDDIKQENEEVEIHNNENRSKKIESKQVNPRRKRIIIPDGDDDSDTDVDTQTYDSLSVNCRPLFSLPSSDTKNEDHYQQSNSQTSPLMSFGEGGEEKDDEEYIEQELNISIEDDIIDLGAISPEFIELIDEEMHKSIEHINKETSECMEQINEKTCESHEYTNEETSTSKNLVNGNEETSDGNLSDDFFDSPTKSASPPDRLVIDLTPRSRNGSLTNNVGSSPSSSDSSRPKGKPKITSDEKLEKIIHIPARIKLQRPSIAVSQSSPVINSNEVQTPSTHSLTEQSLSNGRTPTSRGLKAKLEQVKCNLNNEKSVQEYQNAKFRTNAKHVDESFESICQDLTNLSNTESITLYKGSEGTASSTDEVVVLSNFNDDAQQKEDSTSSAVVNDNDSETQSATESTAAETPSTALYQRPQFNFSSNTTAKKPTLKVSGSGDTAIPLSQQKRPLRVTRSSMNSNTSLPVDSALRGFSRIPRKDPRLNKSAGPATPSERDPRLNKSASPAALPERDPRFNNSASPATLSERDPRLNRLISPNKALSVPTAGMRVTRSTASLQKSPGLSSADPRLTRGQSRPRSTTPTPPTNISPSIAEKGADVKIVDPRLRKRKEREEAEKAAKLAEEQVPQREQSSQVSQFGQSSSPTEKKRTVFQRLGCKEPSPVRAPAQNEFISIIKSRNSSPTKSSYDDDDNISLHPGISDFYDSSDEDDKDSSPRHRKFESERNRTMCANSSQTIQTNAPQQRLSVKQRIGLRVGDAEALGNRREPISAPSDSPSNLVPPLLRPATTAMTPVNTLLNRQARFALGARAQQQARVPSLNVLPPNLTVPPPNLSVPPPTVTRNTSFMDSFYQMNAKQMMQDEEHMMTDEQTSEVYVTFNNGTADKPSEYDHISILDNKPDTSIKGLSDPKYTFFKNQCYRMLRDGKCKTELSTCHFHHHGTLLLRTAKTKNPEFIKAIVDTCIEQNFDYYLDNVWKEILPVIKTDAFTVYQKLYQANKRGQHFVLQLLNYCLTEGIHTVDSFLRKIAPIIEDNDIDTVQAICVAIKNKLADGFCWETIKVICKKAAPPRDMVELVLLQCLKRKKNRNHILEVHDMIKKKMIALDRNKISNNLLKPFYELVARNNPPDTNKEILSTMPLMNVTNNLINGQSFERQSVNVPKSAVQFTGVQKITKTATKRTETLTPISPDNTPLRSPSEIQAQTPIKGESTNFAEYTVKTVDKGEPISVFRDRFWKLYSAVNCVSNGLTHQDYDYVWQQLDKFTQEEVPKEMLKKAYYQILCNEVTSSEHHLSEVIKRAVKESSKKSTCLLFEVGIHALIDLGNSELWVMALELLNRLKVFEPEMLPTAFILISAEIYLANNDPLEALVLLQRTKLIRTNRDEWLVNDSKKADEKHRNKVVFILLQALAYVDPDKAVFLFKELMADQYIYYYPIDLSRYLDKFTLVLFMHKRLDLAAEMARLVMDHDMTYQKSTYQELLSRLLSVDEVLVNQILEYAVNLGYYNDMKIRQGFTTLIIDYNYTEEELYLVIKRLVHKLALNLGPVIPRLKSSHLKVTLVLEDIPTGKRLYKDETVSKINLNKNKHMRRVISNILATRFSPKIKLSQTKADRFCKIMSRTLVDHLKHWH